MVSIERPKLYYDLNGLSSISEMLKKLCER